MFHIPVRDIREQVCSLLSSLRVETAQAHPHVHLTRVTDPCKETNKLRKQVEQ